MAAEEGGQHAGRATGAEGGDDAAVAAASERGGSGLAAPMLGSAMAGILARLPCHPLDTIKARLQVQTSAAAPAYRGVWQGLAAIVRSEGLRGLYRGMGVTMIGSGPAGMLYFTSYEVASRRLAGSLSPTATALTAGMVAEIVSCLLWVPIDVVKERMQVQTRAAAAATGAPYYRSTTDALRQIMAREGLAGVYRGYGATIASFGPFSALYFAFYERLKAAAAAYLGVAKRDAHDDVMLPFSWQLGTACTAGGAAAWLTSPLDLAKLRLQVQRGMAAAGGGGGSAGTAAAPFAYRNLLHGLRTIVSVEGTRALFRGAGARVAYHAPATAVTMTLFERCKDAAATALAWAQAPPPASGGRLA